ncbi:sigma-70 family RNA polymerase sigma factor [Candidatus Poribacteria bacterium]|nr:sigma-70 family RNA polymerase sigma factor [Candidatus Poribacteria bacterium]
MRLSDEELMVSCSNGKVKDFSIIMERYQDRIMRYIKGIVKNHDLAQDLTQETFLRAFRSRESYTPKAPFAAWIYRIATNLCYDEFRKKSFSKITSLNKSFTFQLNEKGDEETMELHEMISDKSMPPDEEIEKEEQRNRLRIAIQSLSEKHRTVIMMHIYQGMEYADIARELSCSVGTIKSRMHYAIKTLKQMVLPGSTT